MSLQNAIKAHSKANYFAVVKTVPHIKGISLTLPKNIYLDKEEETFIYEIEEHAINVYNRSKKIESYYCPEYAIRDFIGLHLLNILDSWHMSEDLLKVFKDDKEAKGIAVIDAIESPTNEKVKKKEEDLHKYITGVIDGDLPPKGTEEGYKILFDMFLRGE